MDQQKRELRKFGLSVGGVFLLLAAVTFYFEKSSYPYLAGISLFLMIPGALYPQSLYYVHKYWMIFAEKISVVSTYIILTLTYVFVISPIGLFLKLIGKDLLSIKLDKEATTYWSSVDHSRGEDRFTTPY